ncbi:MFS transporter [Comamonadaceae bacterium G21597-S1]|nr:MFS transporter [Comamonadaceae bacterium G21597-S1]
MSNIRKPHDNPPEGSQARLPAPLVLLLSASAGLAVASIYYSQPMLGVVGAGIGASNQAVGQVPTLTQFGYALGILLLAPLGDRYDRRRIIVLKAAALALALLFGGMAPSIGALLVASLAVGLAATLAQDIVPAAATLAPPAHRGAVVGTVMTGLLLGILLSRVVSGFVAEHLGWRAMFIVASAAVAVAGVALWRGLPRFRPTTELAYGALLGSLGHLWRRHGSLRRATLAQALLSVGFSAFWSTLALMLQGAPFHLGSTAAGSFGLAGAAGALAAPFAGRIADSRGPGIVTRLGTLLSIAAFASMGLATLAPVQLHLGLLVAATVVFDLGVQATLIAHQSIVYGIDPDARSRMNAILFVGMFFGMATGSALGSLALAHGGWIAVVVLATGSSIGALLVRLWPVAATAAQPRALERG